MSSISFQRLTKAYGQVSALDDFSADVMPGRITAFIGANGSGKTTSMRILLGLARPTSGGALVHGKAYAELGDPLHWVGAVIGQGLHQRRTARNHLRIVARQARVSAGRVDEMLALVSLDAVANRRVGGFSLGMRQRLALAGALIADPAVLVLDEPFNGLDRAGIATLRVFLRGFADSGRTVLLASHLLAEITHDADDAIIIDRGHLVACGPIATLSVSHTADPSRTDLDSVFGSLTGRQSRS